MSVFTFLLVTVGLAILLATAVGISLWKHKKSGSGKVQVLGANGLVESELNPEGTVLIGGELWRARSLDGTTIPAHQQVEVAGLDGHLVLVKR